MRKEACRILARNAEIERQLISRPFLLTGAAASMLAPSVALAQDARPLNLAGVPEDSITPALYAQQAGLFTRFGLAVNLSAESSGSAIASGVAGGAFDIAKSSLVGLIVAHSKGIPFILVAVGGVYTAAAPIVGLLVKGDSAIKTAADLNGKTIAVSALSDIFSLSTLAWVDKNGGTSSTIKQLEFPVSGVPEALATGRVDAGAVVEPVLQRAIDGGKVRVLAYPFDVIAPRFAYTAWFATSGWVSQHRAQAQAFNHAMHDASLYANAHKPQTVDLLARFTSVPAQEIPKMTRVECGTVLDPELVQPVIDACARYKLIGARFDARELFAQSLRSPRL